ncbi:MAG: hypothetical protein HY401_08755 [Elusimicrobia bacterium]|nr:hypothetical protein [Elusimicrobiota bacterium]
MTVLRHMNARYSFLLFFLSTIYYLLSTISSFAFQSVIPYDRYGKFEGVGTTRYDYRLKDPQALKRHLPSGVYPNIKFSKTPSKIKADQLERMSRVWAIPVDQCLGFWGSFNPAGSGDPRYSEGVRQFYYAECLERSGRLSEALKAYYATVVHFPAQKDPNGEAAPSGRPAYLGVLAMDALYFITRTHPELGLRYIAGEVRFENQNQNQLIRIWPGRLVRVSSKGLSGGAGPLIAESTRETNDSGGVELVRWKRGRWSLKVDGRPFFIQGVHYTPSPAGAPDSRPAGFWSKLRKGFLGGHGAESGVFLESGWSADRDQNGIADIQEAWLDANGNGRRDAGEPALGDFGYMALLGVNTVVLDYPPQDVSILDEAHRRWGLFFIISGLPDTALNLTDSDARDRELGRIENLVERYRKKNYILAWSLAGDIDFASHAARLINEMDGRRPIIFRISDAGELSAVASHLAGISILGLTVRPGAHGLGESSWRALRELWGKPVLVWGYGAPAYGRGVSQKEVEAFQAAMHERFWADLVYHRAEGPGLGISIGGSVWEWVDSWWRDGVCDDNEECEHDARPAQKGPFADGHDYPEWYGLVRLGDGPQGALTRIARKAYWSYSRRWKQ